MNPLILSITLATAVLSASAEETPAEDPLEIHRQGADRLVEEQDELSADVQQLVLEQTHPKVIELLGKVENIMDETTERLADADTGGATIAAQTEIIELIHAAAKEKQQQSGSQTGGAMMEMMERMMGKNPQGQNPGEEGKAGDSGGQGQTGGSDTANQAVNGNPDGAGQTRRVPKSSGTAGSSIPQEFRRAFDAYNRGAELQVK